jgi:hypothetical protein
MRVLSDLVLAGPGCCRKHKTPAQALVRRFPDPWPAGAIFRFIKMVRNDAGTAPQSAMDITYQRHLPRHHDPSQPKRKVTAMAYHLGTILIGFAGRLANMVPAPRREPRGFDADPQIVAAGTSAKEARQSQHGAPTGARKKPDRRHQTAGELVATGLRQSDNSARSSGSGGR